MPYVPDSVFKSGVWGEMSAVEAKVYVTLCQHYNRKERVSYPSRNRIAKIAGCSVRQVSRVLNSLEEKGLIVRQKKENPYGKDFNFYKLPDFLVYELEQKAKYPEKHAKDIVSLAKDIMSLMGDIKRSSLETSSHPNYIINHINIINSFNSSKKKKKERFLAREVSDNFSGEPETESMADYDFEKIREECLKPLYEKLGKRA